jgi:protein tyrosine/serine phosphatase
VKSYAVLILVALAGAACTCSSRAPSTGSPTPASTTGPEQERPGLPNFHRVDEGVYRGAQPTAEGMRELEKLGVKTVLNLRSMHSDRELLKGTKLDYVDIPMHTWHPEREDIRAAMKVLTDPARKPVFVHCQYGSDRTGVVCAVYRVLEEGWTKDRAIREMTSKEYGFHALWQNLVDFVREYPVERSK